MGSIYLGECLFRLHGVVDHLPLDTLFGPFLSSRPARCTYDLTLHTRRDTLPQLDATLEYRRDGLEFRGRPDQGHSWYSGSISGFLASFELAVYQVVKNRGGMLVHASAGVVADGAWLMPGPSGTGKSTAARGGFSRVLSDERLVLLPDADGFSVWGTPFWSDDRQLPLDAGSATLVGIAHLSKAERPSVQSFSRAEMLAWLLRSVVVYDHEQSGLEAAFDLASRVVESVECINLDFPPEGIWATSTLSQIGIAS